jgi:hypothetical protein
LSNRLGSRCAIDESLIANPFGRNAVTRGALSRIVVKEGEPFHLRFGILVHGSYDGKEFDPRAACQDYVDSCRIAP